MGRRIIEEVVSPQNFLAEIGSILGWNGEKTLDGRKGEPWKGKYMFLFP